MKLVLICMSFVLTLATALDFRCYQPVKYGDCKGHYKQWSFRPFDKKCVEFDYSGCGGNGNRFWTEFECVWYCYALTIATAPPRSYRNFYY